MRNKGFLTQMNEGLLTCFPQKDNFNFLFYRFVGQYKLITLKSQWRPKICNLPRCVAFCSCSSVFVVEFPCELCGVAALLFRLRSTSPFSLVATEISCCFLGAGAFLKEALLNSCCFSLPRSDSMENDDLNGFFGNWLSKWG